jgi:hypothetical protein
LSSNRKKVHRVIYFSHSFVVEACHVILQLYINSKTIV